MSAYVVENETINRVISALITTQTNLRGPIACLGYDLNAQKDRQRLCHDMAALNVKAVRDHYGEDEQEDVSDVYRFTPEPNLNFVQPFKSLECYLYQCNEGDNDKAPLFKALEQIKVLMAYQIVRRMPAYESAKWE